MRICRARPHQTANGSTAAVAGILLFTSAPDAEGTLGGLVNLGQVPEALRRSRRSRRVALDLKIARGMTRYMPAYAITLTQVHHSSSVGGPGVGETPPSGSRRSKYRGNDGKVRTNDSPRRRKG